MLSNDKEIKTKNYIYRSQHFSDTVCKLLLVQRTARTNAVSMIRRRDVSLQHRMTRPENLHAYGQP